jgi:hypothetical protein
MDEADLRSWASATDAGSLRTLRRMRAKLLRARGATLVPAALALARLARSDDVPGLGALLRRALNAATATDADALAVALAGHVPPEQATVLVERARRSSDPAIAVEAELRAIRTLQRAGDLAAARAALKAMKPPPNAPAHLRASHDTVHGLQLLSEARMGAALERLERAFDWAAGCGADFEASELAGMIGNAHHDAGAIPLAIRWYGFAMKHATRAGSTPTRAIFALYTGWAQHENGRRAAARRAYAIARRGLGHLSLRRFRLHADALLALLTLRGPAARWAVVRSASELERMGDHARAAAVGLLAWVVEATEAPAAGPRGSIVALLRCRRALPAGAGASDDERIARRMVVRALERAERIVGRRKADLRVAPDGRRVQVGDRIVSFAKYPTHARIVVALAEATLEGRRLSHADLFAAGWPGERIRDDAAVHRVHVALSSLRRSGLGALLPRNTEGYAFDGATIGLLGSRAAPIEHD